MRLALAQAQAAVEAGEVPVGALLRLDDGRCFAAFNAPIALRDPTAHAEIRAIRSACEETGNYRLPGSTLYVTLEPCAMCAGAIVHARIARVVYAAADPKSGAVASLHRLLADPRLNHRPAVTAGILARESGELLRGFFRRRRG